MTRKRGMDTSHGLTDDNTKEAGSMESNTEKESTLHLQVKNEKVFGKMENE